MKLIADQRECVHLFLGLSTVTEIRVKVNVIRFRSVSEEAEDTFREQQRVDRISRVQIGEITAS